LIAVESSEQCVLFHHEILEGTFHLLSAIGGEPDSNRPRILRIGFATDESPLLKVIEPVRHCSRRDQRLCEELPWRQVIGRTDAAKRGEHIESPGLEIMPGKDDGSLAFQVVSQPRDAREDLERRDIDARKRQTPSFYEVINFVFHRISSVFDAQIYLDIKR
jgi:hypothetical protein